MDQSGCCETTAAFTGLNCLYTCRQTATYQGKSPQCPNPLLYHIHTVSHSHCISPALVQPSYHPATRITPSPVSPSYFPSYRTSHNKLSVNTPFSVSHFPAHSQPQTRDIRRLLVSLNNVNVKKQHFPEISIYDNFD